MRLPAGPAVAGQSIQENSVRNADSPGRQRAGPANAERSTQENSVQSAVRDGRLERPYINATNAAGVPRIRPDRPDSAPNVEIRLTREILSSESTEIFAVRFKHKFPVNEKYHRINMCGLSPGNV